MTTPAARWADIKALFEATVDLPAAAREPLMAAAALAPDALAELRSLLAHHDEATGGAVFMAENAATALAEAPALAAAAGQRLGAWEIVRAIGAGGMGEVFEVRRADGRYEGRAAVKLLKRGMDSAAVLQRFAQERQALARLSHPHIARLLDAGASDDGLPYFVLEYVNGRPLDEAARPLSLGQRLHLFLQLADAVAHAHRNLLVHRDLKPGNVLVDGDGQIKLLDFGIAKALDPLEGSDGHTTIGGQRPYTPNYASPEQVRGEPVSTATDIYSLGVLLYQMLTGTRPTGRNATTPQEAARSVLEDEPTRPSQLSAREAVDPQWINTRKTLEGDLDNILLKALEKTPERRYASVDALAADINAYLQGRPVSARPASAAYVLGKFLRRNRWAVLPLALGGAGLMLGLAAALVRGQALAALGAIGLASGLLLAVVQMRKATLAQQRAETHVQQLRQLGRELVVEYGDAITYVPGGREHKARLLSSTLGYLQRLQAQQGVADAGLQAEMGMMHARLAHLRVEGEFNASEDAAEAEHHARQAVALCQAGEAAARDEPALYRWWAVALGDLARLTQRAGRPQQALLELEQADALLARALLLFPASDELRRNRAALQLLGAHVLYGWDRPHLNRPDDALHQLQQLRAGYLQAIATAAVPHAYDVFQVGTVVGTQALILLRLGRWAEALAAAHESVDQREHAVALEPHNRTMQGGLAAERNLLAGLCLDHGDAARALATSQPGWDSLARLGAEDPGNETWAAQRRFLAVHHGRALLGCGQPAAAIAALQVSADWLQAEQAGATTQKPMAPRLQQRLARTWLALAQARQALGSAPGPTAEQALRLMQSLVQAQPGQQAFWLLLAECAWAQRAWAVPSGPAGVAVLDDLLDLADQACTRALALGPVTLSPDAALVAHVQAAALAQPTRA